jgi:hypothetical protein
MIVFNHAITKIRVYPKLENDNRVVYNKKSGLVGDGELSRFTKPKNG